MVFCKKTNTLQGIFFVTLRQQKLVEATSFNELFLYIMAKVVTFW